MSRDSQTDVCVGQVIDGRYRLIEQLGRGGMGCVYRAEHAAIRREVALKLLAPRYRESSEADQARFEREAFATGRLRHPNCVAITDFGAIEDGTRYLVMELLDGEPLSARLEREGRMPVARALHIMRHILAGLAHAHELGVVHRDLKPQNVVLVEHLGDPEFAKVLDFGLAKLVGPASEEEGGGKLTAAGITFGTPHYMSPEQAFGKPIDHRADLYAASVMLFELIAGEPPFQSDDMRGVLMAHATRTVPRIHEVCREADVPVEVELLIRQGLAKDPRDRMSSAYDYIAGIERCLDALEAKTTERLPTAPPTSSVHPPPPPAGTEATVPMATSAPQLPIGASPSTSQPPARRSRTLWVGGSVAGALVAVVAVVALTAGPSDGTAPAEAASKPSLEDPESPAEPRQAVEPDEAPIALPGTVIDTPAEPDDPVAAEIDEALALAPRRHDAAQKKLEALQKAHPDDARIAYHLGKLYFDRPWPPEALKSYEKAISLEADYRADETIITHAIRLLSSRSSRWRAARLLKRDVGEPALPYLDETAEGHGNKKVRQRAARIAQQIRAR